MSSNGVHELLMYAANFAPYAVVWLVGIILALIRWREHPMPSLMALIGFGLLLFSLLTNAILQRWIIAGANSAGMSIGTSLTVLNLFRLMLTIPGWVCLIVALFGWRSSGQGRWRDEEPDRNWQRDWDRRDDRARPEDFRK